jgi:hypothetical protein
MTIAFEAFLARIYVDDGARARFLQDPAGEAARAGLAPDEIAALERIDREGLELAAASIAAKRRACRHVAERQSSDHPTTARFAAR